MNIFYLDEDPFVAARYHCDKHVIKMIAETSQLIGSVFHATDNAGWMNDARPVAIIGRNLIDIPKPGHMNHPSAIWARSGKANFAWLLMLFRGLLQEYDVRYGKPGKYVMQRAMDAHIRRAPPGVPSVPFYHPPLCMPAEYARHDPVDAYRAYYIGAKSDFAEWNHGEAPFWWRLPSNS